MDDLDQLVYYKCTACSECFTAEEIFFAHTRTWHCKILVCEGQNPTLDESTFPLQCSDLMCVESNDELASQNNESECVETNNDFVIQDNESVFPPSNSEVKIEPEIEQPRETSQEDFSELVGDYGDEMEGSTVETVDESRQPSTSQTMSGFKNNKTVNPEAQFTQSLSMLHKQPPTTLLTPLNVTQIPSHKHRKHFGGILAAKHKISPQNNAVKSRVSKFVPKVIGESDDAFVLANNVRQWQCKFCSYHSQNKANVQKHVHKHTGAKPYRCQHCDKRFSDPSNLSRHRKTVQACSV